MHAIKNISCAVATAAMLTACSTRDRAVDTSSSASVMSETPAMSSAPATAAPSETGAAIATASHADVGQYLTDASGRALYMFERDTKNTSNCNVTDGCAVAWPPFSVATPTSTDTSVRATMLRTITRADDRAQVTYDEMPLYYYEDDKKAGDIEGQGKLEFGGLWYLVSPTGQAIKTGGKKRG